MTIEILGGGRKKKYNPDLGRIANAEYEKQIREAEANQRQEKVIKGKTEQQIKPYQDIIKEYNLEKVCLAFCEGMEKEEEPDFYKIDGGHYEHTLEEVEAFVKVLPGLITQYRRTHFEKFEEHYKYISKFITRFVDQTHFKDGECIDFEDKKEFVFDFTGLNEIGIRLDYVGYLMDNYEKIKIIGDVGRKLGCGAENCKFTVEGNVESITGESMEACDFYIDGKLNEFNEDMENSNTIYIKKDDGWIEIFPKIPEEFDPFDGDFQKQFGY